MSAAARCQLLGKWRIIEADIWDRDYLDLVQPAYIEFGKNGPRRICLRCNGRNNGARIRSTHRIFQLGRLR